MPSENEFSTPYRRVLVVETDFSLVRHLTRVLQPNPVTSVRNLSHAQDFLDRYDFHVVLFDPQQQGAQSVDFLVELTRELPRVRRVIWSRDTHAAQAFGLAHASVAKHADERELRQAILGVSDSSELRTISGRRRPTPASGR